MAFHTVPLIAFSLVTMPWFQLLVFEQILSEIISAFQDGGLFDRIFARKTRLSHSQVLL